MATLTFSNKKLVDSSLIGEDGGVYYTTSSTEGAIRGRKVTTIRAASGLVGMIDWRKNVFVINGVEKPFGDVRSGGFLTNWRGRRWQWSNKTYKVKFHRMQKAILDDMHFGTVRFTTCEPHLLRKTEQATIQFPYEMQDEIERMFVLMAILQTEMHKQDIRKSAGAVQIEEKECTGKFKLYPSLTMEPWGIKL
ncbi:hypothetical protein C8F01DRAFT_1311310 [Mycena amicta]|nr:hypothetical protein C8F01DRAFT_1311310 [Mycena amicta]